MVGMPWGRTGEVPTPSAHVRTCTHLIKCNAA
ncbi:protein of unknown function [Microbacterium sp. Nx66]|nr:protein of unknown function [Microbacterium sp. Nx66]